MTTHSVPPMPVRPVHPAPLNLLQAAGPDAVPALGEGRR
jgi:hypothetical protein